MSVVKTNLNVPIKSEMISKLPTPLQNLSEDDMVKVLSMSYRMCVEHRGCPYEDITGSEVSEKIKSAAMWLKSPARRSCLLLQGLPGTGKTTLTWAIYSMLSTVNTSMLYTTSQKLFDYYNYLAAGTSAAFNEYMNAKRLFLDDLGNEPPKYLYYGVEYNPIELLLNYRYERQLPTIITTNLSDAMIRERYGERISDRFAEMCTILRFSGHSYRK